MEGDFPEITTTRRHTPRNASKKDKNSVDLLMQKYKILKSFSVQAGGRLDRLTEVCWDGFF